MFPYQKSMIFLIFVFMTILPIVFSKPTKKKSTSCDLVMRYDSSSKGIHIYSGKIYDTNSHIEHFVGIPVPIKSINNTLLAEYIDEGLNETHALVSLGYSMIYNHEIQNIPGPLTKKFARGESILRFHNKRFGESRDFLFTPDEPIEYGQMLFGKNGPYWGGIEEMEGDFDDDTAITNRIDVENDPFIIPGCSFQSVTFNKRSGFLLAKRDIGKGEIIEISRALFLPRKAIRKLAPLDELVWFKPKDNKKKSNIAKNETQSTSDVTEQEEAEVKRESKVLLLLGQGALYTGPETVEKPNVIIEWWDPEKHLAIFNTSTTYEASISSTGEQEVTDSTEPESLSKFTVNPNASEQGGDLLFTSNGVQCKNEMFVAFIAAKTIRKGDVMIAPLKIESQRKYVSKKFASPCF